MRRCIILGIAALASGVVLYSVMDMVLALINAIYGIPAEIGYQIMKVF